MSRRRMMMKNRVVNLFDKNSGDIVYKARLSQDGGNYNTFDGNTEKTFISPYIEILPDTTYILRRDIILSLIHI